MEHRKINIKCVCISEVHCVFFIIIKKGIKIWLSHDLRTQNDQYHMAMPMDITTSILLSIICLLLNTFICFIALLFYCFTIIYLYKIILLLYYFIFCSWVV